MKRLVDILAVELKCWPDSLGDAVGQASDGTLHNDMEPLNAEIVRTREKYTMCKNYIMDCVTRAEWQAAVDALNAPKVVEWDGAGLPPTGLACEYRKTDAKYRQGFVAVKVLCYGKERCFLQHEASKNEFTEDLSSLEFRPIRTAEQVAAEEREKAIGELVDVYEASVLKQSYDTRGVMAAIYDAGYRKEPKPCGS